MDDLSVWQVKIGQVKQGIRSIQNQICGAVDVGCRVRNGCRFHASVPSWGGAVQTKAELDTVAVELGSGLVQPRKKVDGPLRDSLKGEDNLAALGGHGVPRDKNKCAQKQQQGRGPRGGLGGEAHDAMRLSNSIRY